MRAIMRTISLICLSCPAGSIIGELPNDLTYPSHHNSILQLQLGAPSAECVNACKVFKEASSSCTGASCLCNHVVCESLEECFSCENVAQKNILQEWATSLKAYLNGCAGEGLSLVPPALHVREAAKAVARSDIGVGGAGTGPLPCALASTSEVQTASLSSQGGMGAMAGSPQGGTRDTGSLGKPGVPAGIVVVVMLFMLCGILRRIFKLDGEWGSLDS